MSGRADRDLARLPKWARDEIERLRRDLAAARAALSESSDEYGVMYLGTFYLAVDDEDARERVRDLHARGISSEAIPVRRRSAGPVLPLPED